MLFTSYCFIGFLIVLFLLYYKIPGKYQWGLLLIASYLFYAVAGAQFLIYIGVTTLFTWYAGLRMEKVKQQYTGYRKLHKAEMTKEEKKLLLFNAADAAFLTEEERGRMKDVIGRIL